MKPAFTFTVAAMLTFPMLLAAQDTIETRVYRNEVGTDFTTLINQLFFVNISQYDQDYQPIYYFTYKRLLKKFNIRFGIGGRIRSIEEPNDRLTDKIELSSSTKIEYRLGVEKTAELGKRWNFHYGVDFRHTFYRAHYDNWGTEDDWGYGRNAHERILSIAPNMMIEFKINNRVSLQTEANFTAYFQREESKRFYYEFVDEHVSNPKPSAKTEVYKQNGTEFTVPYFINIAFKL